MSPKQVKRPVWVFAPTSIPSDLSEGEVGSNPYELPVVVLRICTLSAGVGLDDQ